MTIYSSNSSKKLILIFESILVFLGIIAFDNAFTIAVLCILQLTLSMLLIKDNSRGYRSFSIIFLLILFTFHMGSVICVTFATSLFRDYSFWISSEILMFKAIKFYSTCVFFYTLGVLISMYKYKNKSGKKSNSVLPIRRAYFYGWFFFGLGLIPKFYIDYTKLIISRTQGYLATYNVDLSGIGIVSTLVYPGFFLIMICSSKMNKSKTITNGLTTLTVIYELIMMLNGNRYMGTAFIITIIYFYYSYVARINLRKQLLLFLWALIGIVFMNTIQNVRDSSGITFAAIVSENSGIWNSVLELLNELGGSLNSVMLALYHFPSHVNFAYGKTYLYLPIAILPGISNTTIYKYAIYTQNFSSKTSLGGSCIGEAYYNFGYFGSLLFFS